MAKAWGIKAGGRSDFVTLEQIQKTLLRQRGVKKNQMDDYFSPQVDTGLHDPYLMADMDKAISRISSAIQKKERILVYGDYDVDGVCSTAILMSALRDLGAKAVPFLPHRTDNGYGLDGNVLRELLAQYDLLITVDCGISNSAEIDWLNSRGKDSIVTDHHLVPEVLPKAVAVLHPNHPAGTYPFQFLCGAGVSWKLAMALLANKRADRGSNQEQIFNLLGLACLGTVADMVPLIGENRVIVKYGLRSLMASNNSGLKALVAAAGLGRNSISAEMIAYRIAPLINAAGRIGHPQTALDLLLADTEQAAGEEIAKLKQLNQERRRIGQAVQSQAELAGAEGGNIIVAADTSWPAGVLGLVAGRLCDKYQRPAVVIGSAGKVAIGSARAPLGINIVEVLKPLGSLLTRFGGHEAAAGFTLPIENIAQVKEALHASTVNWESQGEKVKGWADIVLQPQLVGWDLIDMLEQMEPYGQGNERPVFMMRNIYLGHWGRVGKNKEHAKLIFNVNDELLEGIAFGLAEEIENCCITDQGMVDVLGCLEVNEYNGRRSLQMNIKDIGRAGEVAIIQE
ncbi:MAG: single-stranded-DNA-specific exonuclease RecJ [Candidatus Andersenbacteria bacterium RIFCSPHIGHO2_12_FULL_46_9]|nr:MAG: Single-stranded-DNA-specific exonuclease RecJ [Parcubacteria group bacterium GW2011_GWA2_45_14]OGY35657.1 MAG: single-stranded-DNA-specific exonuclease RecJ [Candidatus Andersenbacteria bacterium RIFCSPHIGHO2_02_FULL_46_16]OGY36859.1 MAG: single-stranded-DNA-specific exonuclease RecJ [Candidatus Andersenbacteria bacterium RIFCSPLOWO2_02_FULL_46_11]OGY37823.1 MAG: single-stranded-DNA-specific exonuclease RecJ [Candidatus Andersenbacteria bacterium RIFCSPHIGHO2_12_FULL_46_9]OGY41659.1 MAG